MTEECQKNKNDCQAPRVVDAEVLGKELALTSALAYQKSAIVSRTLIETAGCTVTLFAFDAGQGLSEHSAPFHAMVQMLEGTAEIRIGGMPHTLNAGQAIVMPADVPHAVRALTAVKMLPIMARTE